jgi:site-specific recombinase XerD
MKLEDLVHDFERSLVSRNKSPRTAETYHYALADFLAFVKKYGVVEASSLASEHIEGWQASLAPRLKPRSRSLMGTALRRFLEWATRYEKPVSPNLYLRVAAVHVPELMPQPIALDDVTKVLRYFSSLKTPSPMDLRDRALFLCLLSTGGRVGEVLQLDRRDLNRTSIVRQKGARPVPMTLLAPVREAISKYLGTRTDGNPALWVTMRPNNPARLTDADVRGLLRRVARLAGVERFTTHQLRHTAATLLFEANVPESLITDYLGHESPDALRTYVDITSRRQEAGVTMERLLIKAEGQAASPSLDLESVAAKLDSIVAAIDQGTITAATPTGPVRQTLKEAAGALRRLHGSSPAIDSEPGLPLFS